MKTYSITFLSLFSAAAFAGPTYIIGADVETGADGKAHPSVSVGFWDSSFGGAPELFCYAGDVKGACAAVHEGEARVQEDYANGDHSTIHVTGCEVSARGKDQVVTVKYELSDDYSRAVTAAAREIRACE